MELSKRLQAVADLVSDGEVVADIGTDHGYIPIYLVQSKKCSKVYAMDINEGPYLRAKQHIAGYGLSTYIETRLSNGLHALEVGEASAIIIAGMGGGLVTKIMEQDKHLWDSIHEFVLQPQSEIDKVRSFLWMNQWEICEEEIVYEDGKYYPMMRIIRGSEPEYSVAELRYGRKLIEKKHPVLLRFLEKEIALKEQVLSSLEGKTGTHIEKRMIDLRDELEVAYEVQRHLITAREDISTREGI